MFDSSAATPELGAAKTITQIVYEQLQDNVCIRYGSRTKYLYTSRSRHEIARVLAEMKSVLGGELDRSQIHAVGEGGLAASRETILRQR